jgi:hypothetical protein
MVKAISVGFEGESDHAGLDTEKSITPAEKTTKDFLKIIRQVIKFTPLLAPKLAQMASCLMTSPLHKACYFSKA